MGIIGYTSLVTNIPNKINGLPPFYYRYRNCNTRLTGNTPATRYQIQKQIQNTVRVYASLYTDNKKALSAYRKPTVETHGVCWNQQSDRPFPSVQKATVPTGYYQSQLNNKHHSVTSSRPGGQTPGGVGCDIKHNSYDRYLNRLKGKGPLRRGPVPPILKLSTVPFNPAYPIYGDKVMKTNIVAGCNCPTDKPGENVYDNPSFNQTFPMTLCPYQFRVGESVVITVSPKSWIFGQIVEVIGDDIYSVSTKTNGKPIIIPMINGNDMTPLFKKCILYCGETSTIKPDYTASEIEAIIGRNSALIAENAFRNL